ncbi:MAG TPA: AmmeMemoRadiSam system radical SAM enzyme [Spirochaetia bacterium]|nr:AmmeMemoRadiSam system radical SAM enzyme [Spirochaetia bacterium]
MRGSPGSAPTRHRPSSPNWGSTTEPRPASLPRARWFEGRPDGRVQCLLCPHACRIREGGTGTCGVRRAERGAVTLPYYGRISALAVDPIEKKPLYHFHPGERILSAGFVGCSLRCKFCQNWHISQSTDSPTRFVAPDELVDMAREERSFGIAYTYSEPLIHAEYVIDAARAARAAGLANVLVSNGYLNPEPAAAVLELMDAANIDLKSYDADFYRSETGGDLDSVRRFIAEAGRRTHLEVTTLVIPTRTDDDEQIDGIARFVASIDPGIPLHLSCYYPQYRYKIPPTPAATVERLAAVARKHLRFVYLGNIGPSETNTLCPGCGALLVRRLGYAVRVEGLERRGASSACARCGTAVPIALGA